MSLSDFFKTLDVQDARKTSDQKQILIIDQFEELFSTHHEEWQKREDFLSQLAQVLQRYPSLSVLLAMREDHIAWLDPYAHLLPNRLRIRYSMQALQRDRALEAIKGPVKYLRPFAEGAAEKLVDNLASIKVQKPNGELENRPGQFVEPVQLQVVCQNLWQHLPLGGSHITEKDIEDVGDVNTSLGKYYAAQVKAVAQEKNVSERKIRRWFSDKLISPGGIRTLVPQEPGKSSGLENEVIQALPYLIRVEPRGGSAFYELTHDRLVDPILTNNKEWEKGHYSPLQRQAALWKDQKKDDNWLLIDRALAEVERWAKKHPDELSELEEEFLAASRHHQEEIDADRESQKRELAMAQKVAEQQRRFARLGAVAWILFFLAAGFAIFAVNQSLSAQKIAANAEKIAAETLMQDAANSHELGRYEDSVSKFLTAQKLDPDVVQTMESTVLSNFCSDGSLFEDPANFKAVCDQAVTQDSNNGAIRDKRGINRVLLGDFEGAIDDFGSAVKWYRLQKEVQLAEMRQDWLEQLESNQNPFDEKTFNALKAQALAESAARLNGFEQYEEMIKRFLEAQRLDSNVVETMQDAVVLNNICWFGNLFKHAREVKDVCERAVELKPADGGYIDSRGLNRALLGDYEGAIEDFKIAVSWFIKNEREETIITKRKNWITALSSGQNPFTDALLEALKHE